MERKFIAVRGSSHCMTVTILFSLVAVTLTSKSDQNVIERVFSNYRGEKYEFIITEADVKRSPVWRVDEESPPLKPRAAAQVAEKYVNDKIGTNSQRWLLHKITLAVTGSDQWIYIIDFIPPQGDKVLLTELPQFKVPVLMDGTIPRCNVEPSRKK